ncbi:hypothetical protein [Streptomyces tubercidicus]|uniref:hypothetical protein n=1 Tax=Streptomyces tubercidicus TaxID=47759 RepID=UPI003465D7A7
MGIAPQDRLETLCRADMEAIEREVAAIKAAMKKVNEMMAHTWTGTNADHWRTGHEARMRQLRTLPVVPRGRPGGLEVRRGDVAVIPAFGRRSAPSR